MKQITVVLKAFKEGSRTTPEVSAVTGFPIKHVSAYARALVRQGRLRNRGLIAASGPGRRSYWYEPARPPE